MVGQLGFFGFRNMPRLGGLEQLALAQSLLWHRFSIHPFTVVFILHTGAKCLSKGIQGTRWGTSWTGSRTISGHDHTPVHALWRI